MYTHTFLPTHTKQQSKQGAHAPAPAPPPEQQRVANLQFLLILLPHLVAGATAAHGHGQPRRERAGGCFVFVGMWACVYVIQTNIHTAHTSYPKQPTTSINESPPPFSHIHTLRSVLPNQPNQPIQQTLNRCGCRCWTSGARSTRSSPTRASSGSRTVRVYIIYIYINSRVYRGVCVFV